MTHNIKRMMNINTLHFVLNIWIIAILLIAVISLFGYIFNVPYLYRWGEVPMAVNTAIEFTLVGIVLLVMNNIKAFLYGRKSK